MLPVLSVDQDFGLHQCVFIPLLYVHMYMLASQIKNKNNSAVLHAIVMGLAFIYCTCEGACHT